MTTCKIIFFLTVFYQFSFAGQAENLRVINYVANSIVAHSPNKQYNTVTAQYRDLDPVNTHYATSGSACEAMRFLTNYKYLIGSNDPNYNQTTVTNKINSLLSYITQNQNTQGTYGTDGSRGGFKAFVGSTRYYSIDAAFCGDALLNLYNHTNDQDHLDAAIEAGNFLLKMQDPNSLPFPLEDNSIWDDNGTPVVLGGVIESIDMSNPSYPAIDNALHTKNLIAVKFLNDLYLETNNQDYLDAAKKLLDFLKYGLKNRYEWYQPKSFWTSANGAWNRNSSGFIYADSYAYALRSLSQLPTSFSDTSNEQVGSYLLNTYTLYNTVPSNNPSSDYATNLFWSGYLNPSLSTTGTASEGTYYDVVTAGILYPARNTINTTNVTNQRADFDYLISWLDTLINSSTYGYNIYWAYSFGFPSYINAIETYIDMTTLANIGDATISRYLGN